MRTRPKMPIPMQKESVTYAEIYHTMKNSYLPPISTQRKFAIYTEIDPLRTEALKKVKTELNMRTRPKMPIPTQKESVTYAEIYHTMKNSHLPPISTVK